MDDKLKQIIAKLSVSTKEGKFNWVTEARPSEYFLKLDACLVSVDKWKGENEDTGEKYVCCDIRFRNKTDGIIFEEYTFEMDRDATDYKILINLYDIVRRKVTKVDEKLDELSKEIDEKSKPSAIDRAAI